MRTGLLERALVLGADHREGPHMERPETGRRLLAHIDALGEAGLSLAELSAFAGEVELEHPGALWVLTILFGCLNIHLAEDAFEAWVASLDGSLFLTYRGVLEIAEALAVVPNPLLRGRAAHWVDSSSDVLCSIALETMPAGHLSRDLPARVTQAESPLVRAATERLLLRAPNELRRPTSMKDWWLDGTAPALSYEAARARILGRDLEPLVRLRERDARVIAALGPHAIDVLALAGDGRDDELAGDLARALPATPPLLDAMGRAGSRSLFPRLIAEVGGDDFDEEAHRALVVALGDVVTRPSVQAWEQAIAALPRATEATRLRGGEAHTLQSVVEEMKRPDLSAEEIRIRTDEVFLSTGRVLDVEWGAFGVSLERLLSDLTGLVR
ncbi:hypothetical protein [Sorangium sp. So ce1151]|uniref:hypothetical protein n=1 Tax=Sorangium sp. So ce1151 TaxID=3133332 RepID=UPI003F6490C9